MKRLARDWNLNNSQDVYHILYEILKLQPPSGCNPILSKTAIEKATVPWTGVDGDDDFDLNAYQISLNVDERSSLINAAVLTYSTMVNSKFLRRIAHQHSIIPLILEWRRLSKAVNLMKSLYHHSEYDFDSLHTSRISVTIDVIRSSTGRILMTNPPLQLIPKGIDLSGYVRPSIHAEIQKAMSASSVDPRESSVLEVFHILEEKIDVTVFNAEDKIKYNQRGPIVRPGKLRKVFYDKYISGEFQLGALYKKAEDINGLTLAQYWNNRGHAYEHSESEKIHVGEVELFQGYGRESIILSYPTDQVYRRRPLPITDDCPDTTLRNQHTYKPRNVIKASKGMILLSLDYREIELRLLAHYSQDINLIKSRRSLSCFSKCSNIFSCSSFE